MNVALCCNAWQMPPKVIPCPCSYISCQWVLILDAMSSEGSTITGFQFMFGVLEWNIFFFFVLFHIVLCSFVFFFVVVFFFWFGIVFTLCSFFWTYWGDDRGSSLSCSRTLGHVMGLGVELLTFKEEDNLIFPLIHSDTMKSSVMLEWIQIVSNLPA